MSVLTKGKILEKGIINIPRSKEEILKDKMQMVKLLNKPKDKEENNPTENILCYKRVYIKPFGKKKKNNIKKRNKNQLFIKINNSNSVKQDNFYILKKKYYTNNDISANPDNKTYIDNKKIILNNINPDFFINEKFKYNNTSNINDKSKYENGKILNNKFIRIEYNENEENNKKDTFNNYSGKDSDQKKFIKIEEKNINFSEDSNLGIFEKNKEKVNINYINSISNNVYGKINSPIFLDDISSLSNNLDNNYNLFKYMSNRLINKNKNKINKNSNKNILCNDIDLNIYMNKTSDEAKSKYNYLNSITELNPNYKKEEIKLNKSNDNIKEIKINKQLDFIENKKYVLSNIEKEKQKLEKENINNYIKYIKLIQQEQQQYKEYDQYLKNELKKNKNNQIQLQLFKENYLNFIQNKKAKERKTKIPIPENRTLSLNNLENKIIKKRLGNGKKSNLLINIPNRFNHKNFIECGRIKTENSIKSIPISAYSKEKAKINNNHIIKNNLHGQKILNTINHFEKSKKKLKITNFKKNRKRNNINKDFLDISQLSINVNNPILSTDNSLNYEKKIFTSVNKMVKRKKKIKFEILGKSKNIKTDNNENAKKRNTFSLREERLLFSRSTKNMKNEKRIELNLNNNNKFNRTRSRFLKKINEINEYYYGVNSSNNTYINKSSHDLHKMISEEKKKFLNNMSGKRHNSKKIKIFPFYK